MSAEEVGLFARRLTQGLYIHDAAMVLLRSPRSAGLTPPSHPAGGPPNGLVMRKDGTVLPYDWVFLRDAATTDGALGEELDRAFLLSALVMLGDRLAAENYFDRAPILEMVRHLRNAAGHGNRFEIRDPVQLQQWPAHTRDAKHRGATTFEISRDLDGTTFLFDYMASGDVLDVLISVGTHLLQMAEEQALDSR
jgi:hypothetical protein